MGCFKLLLDGLPRMDLRLHQSDSSQEALSIRSNFSCFRLAVSSTEMRLVLGSPGVVPLGELLGHSFSHAEKTRSWLEPTSGANETDEMT